VEEDVDGCVEDDVEVLGEVSGEVWEVRTFLFTKMKGSSETGVSSRVTGDSSAEIIQGIIQTIKLNRMRRWDGEGMITGREGEVEKWKGDEMGEMGERARCFLGAGSGGGRGRWAKVRLESKNRRL
jgi:hypothetical protein